WPRRPRPPAPAASRGCPAEPRPSCRAAAGRSDPGPAGSPHLVRCGWIDRQVLRADTLGKPVPQDRPPGFAQAQLLQLLPGAEENELHQVDPLAAPLAAELIEHLRDARGLRDGMTAVPGRHAPKCNTGATPGPHARPGGPRDRPDGAAIL